MIEVFNFSMKEHLPVIRKAYDAEELQMFELDSGWVCQYNGPCAIGACIPKNKRAQYDVNEFGDSGVETLHENNIFSFENVTETMQFTKLQKLHDEAVIGNMVPLNSPSADHDYVIGLYIDKCEKVEAFGEYLAELEEEYL